MTEILIDGCGTLNTEKDLQPMKPFKAQKITTPVNGNHHDLGIVFLGEITTRCSVFYIDNKTIVSLYAADDVEGRYRKAQADLRLAGYIIMDEDFTR